MFLLAEMRLSCMPEHSCKFVMFRQLPACSKAVEAVEDVEEASDTEESKLEAPAIGDKEKKGMWTCPFIYLNFVNLSSA